MERLTPVRPRDTARASPVVHLGLGAFARSFVLPCLEDAAGPRRIGVTGVSMRSDRLRAALEPQGWAYHVVTLGPEGLHARPVESLDRVLVAADAPKDALAALDFCDLVTLTVTEKGYCHVPATGVLDLSHRGIRADIAAPERPVSVPGLIVRALARRRAAGREPFVALSCDNLPRNGALLRGVVLDFAGQVDPGLRDWIAAEGRFPSTMVDRITPATTPGDVDLVARLTGCKDAAPVVCEPWFQFVIENQLGPAAQIDWCAAGAVLTDDIAAWERLKLQMLNGAHSALAYLGLLAGCATTAEAVALPPFEALLRHIWRSEVGPTLAPPDGVDPEAHGAALLARFANPEIRHRLDQIAADGSQKLPQRVMAPLAEALAAGRDPEGLFLVLAAWLRCIEARADQIEDPLAPALTACARASDPAAALPAIDGLFPAPLAADPRTASGLRKALASLDRLGPEGAARAVLDA